MDRRTLLQSVVVGGAVGLGAGIGGARLAGAQLPGAAAPPNATQGPAAADIAPAKSAIRLRMVTSWPKNLPGLGESAERVARLVRVMSGGELDIRVYAAGEVVGAFEVFDAVASGAADLYHAADYYWTGKSPAYPFFTAIPFGLTAQEQIGWIDYGGGQALWNEIAAPFNIVPMMAANTTHQMGGWFRREINSLNDFRGLKMRIPGLGGDLVRALGGSAVTIPGGEVFGALQSGLIDATEFVGPWNDFFLGFYRVAPFYYGPGFHEPGALLCVGVNRQVFERMSRAHQEILRAACAAVNNSSLGEFTYQNAAYLKILTDEHGVKLRRFPPDVVKRAREAARDIMAKAGSEDALSRRILTSYETVLNKAGAWAEISDAGYYPMRDGG
jgi:TRAP-type mannitol/chloroaromatic compound transport system substrate-binding protein